MLTGLPSFSYKDFVAFVTWLSFILYSISVISCFNTAGNLIPEIHKLSGAVISTYFSSLSIGESLLRRKPPSFIISFLLFISKPDTPV